MVSKDPTTRFRRFEVLSFDCFGTLIDFERGVLTALRPILERRGVALSDDELLETYAALKLPIERSSPFKPFREVLLRTMDSIGRRFGFEPTPCPGYFARPRRCAGHLLVQLLDAGGRVKQ